VSENSQGGKVIDDSARVREPHQLSVSENSQGGKVIDDSTSAGSGARRTCNTNESFKHVGFQV